VTPADLERFKIYAPLVRTLYGQRGVVFSNPQLLESSFALRFGEERFLLSNLTGIFWILNSTVNGSTALCCFLSPALTSWRVVFQKHTHHELPDLVRSTKRVAPFLRNVKITGKVPSLEIRPYYETIRTLFDSFRIIRSLKLNLGGCASLESTLRPLPQLDSLSLCDFHSPIRTDLDARTISPRRFAVLFPAIRKLDGDLSSVSLPMWLAFRAYHRILRISAVVLIGELHKSNTLTVLLEAVAKSCPALRTLALDAECAWHHQTENIFPVLKPLLQCRKLVKLDLSHLSFPRDAALRLADRNIEDMASAWADLEELRLEKHSYPADLDASLSTSSIVTLCTKCPRLHTLSITVDTKQLPTAEATPALPSKNLVNLFVCGSPIRDPWGVALWLETVFIVGTVIPPEGEFAK
jgi:hypothetical protein